MNLNLNISMQYRGVSSYLERKSENRNGDFFNCFVLHSGPVLPPNIQIKAKN